MIIPLPIDDFGTAPSPQRGTPCAQAPDTAKGVDQRRLARLRWRCRRGMLENDLVLTRFLDARGATLGDEEAQALMHLLELSDNELWDLISGRADPGDASLQRLVNVLRAS